jgi:outer membrane autotransporter protein
MPLYQTQNAWGMKSGDFKVMPLYQTQNAWGMKSGDFKVDWHGALGGVALGADHTFGSVGSMFRAGLSFSIGGGYMTASGELAETSNHFSFWGIGAYGGWTNGDFAISADVDYTSTYNRLRQDVPSGMGMGDLESDVMGWALSAGLRGEYRLRTDVLDIVPHVGVRYMHLATNSYTVRSGGEDLLDGDAIHQDIWTFPVGVAFSKGFETESGWTVKPSLDLSVIPAAGNLSAKSLVRFTGTGLSADVDARTMDQIAYQGKVGLDFGKGPVRLGLNYALQASEHTTAHGVFATIRFEF